MFGSAARSGPSPAISSSAVSAAWRPAPWFAPIAATSSWRRPSAAAPAATPASVSASSSNVRSATIGSARSYRVDRLLELAEVVERLDHEEVDAAPFQHGRLLGERREAFVLGISDVAERADRAGDVDGAPRHLPRVSGELHGGELICSSSCSRKWVASLRRFAPNVFVSISSAPARMNPRWRSTTLCGERRFASSGDREARDGARQQCAHPAVAADRRAAPEPFEEARRHTNHSMSRARGRREGMPKRWSQTAGDGPPSAGSGTTNALGKPPLPKPEACL